MGYVYYSKTPIMCRLWWIQWDLANNVEIWFLVVYVYIYIYITLFFHWPKYRSSSLPAIRHGISNEPFIYICIYIWIILYNIHIYVCVWHSGYFNLWHQTDDVDEDTRTKDIEPAVASVPDRSAAQVAIAWLAMSMIFQWVYIYVYVDRIGYDRIDRRDRVD